VKPEITAADLHPDYLSTQFALERSRLPAVQSAPANQPAPECCVGVQHHIAHVHACMAENELEPPVLGVSWDGTGYGLDGTIWGGEFFLVTPNDVRRVAHLRPFRLPGGEAAVKEPRRAALGLLHELEQTPCNLSLRMQQKVVGAFSAGELAALGAMLAKGVNSPFCSSVGRLFDAVAALVNLRQVTRFEGQAAMELEFALEGNETEEAYSLRLLDQGSSEATAQAKPILVDWSPMLEDLAADLEAGVPVGKISAKFHNALADAVLLVAKRIAEKRVALSGGCFQNRYLTERVVTRLRGEGFQPYGHQRVPPNDGGICLGQIVAARRETR
jgi:hydrogenase maturation protein HypF